MSMSIEKDPKHYELMYIVPAKFAGEELESIKTKINDLLVNHGAEVTNQVDMGRLRLAYPIKQVFQGFYYVLEFNAEPAKVRKMENLLRIMPEILRYLLINKRILTERELEAEKRLNAAVEAEVRAKGYRETHNDDVRSERPRRKEAVVEVREEEVLPEVMIDPVSAEMNLETAAVLEEVAEVEKEEKKIRKSAKGKKISLEEMDSNLDDLISDDINKLL
jgi:small subunit ribosomal protein S6